MSLEADGNHGFHRPRTLARFWQSESLTPDGETEQMPVSLVRAVRAPERRCDSPGARSAGRCALRRQSSAATRASDFEGHAGLLAFHLAKEGRGPGCAVDCGRFRRGPTDVASFLTY